MGTITYAASDTRKELFCLDKRGYMFRNYEPNSEDADVVPMVGTTEWVEQWVEFVSSTCLDVDYWTSVGTAFLSFVRDGVRFVSDTDGTVEEVEDYIIVDSIYTEDDRVGRSYLEYTEGL